MKYFLDTEFIEDGKTIDLISIALVAEDGRELYLCNQECDFSKACVWVRNNVLTKLPNLAVQPSSNVRPESIVGDYFLQLTNQLKKDAQINPENGR